MNLILDPKKLTQLAAPKRTTPVNPKLVSSQIPKKEEYKQRVLINPFGGIGMPTKQISPTLSTKPVDMKIPNLSPSATTPKKTYIDTVKKQDVPEYTFNKELGAQRQAEKRAQTQPPTQPVPTTPTMQTTPPPATIPTTPTQEPKENEYLTFLKEQYKRYKPIEESLYDTEKRMSDEQLRARQEEERIRKNEAGALQSGVTGQLGELNRVSGKTLADLEISRAADENRLNRIMNAGQKAYEIETTTGKKDVELDKPISLADAQALGLPYGTTMRQAQASGIVPQAKSSDLSADAKTFEYYNSLSPEQKVEFERLTGIKPEDTTSSYRMQSAQNVLGTIDDAINNVSGWTAGFGGQVLKNIGGTQASDLAGYLNTVKGNIGFEALQAMREASKTGGALGSIAVQELTALQSTLASLDQKQKPETLKANLQKIKRHYENAINAMNQAGGQSVGNVFAEQW